MSETGTAPGVSNVLSLGEWIDECVRLGIHHIPVTLVGRCWPQEIIAAAYGMDSAPIQNLLAILKSIATTNLGHGEMYRWDCCAAETLKHRMGMNGACPWEDRIKITPDDPRLVSILEDDWPDILPVAMWKRPWEVPRTCEGYPVEFRAFVEKGSILGISNYYPQVALPSFGKDDDHAMSCIVDRAVEKVRVLTSKLLDSAESFTADWLMQEDGSLAFLEGGPPHREDGGAHPCCFAPGKIDGVALSPREGAVTS